MCVFAPFYSEKCVVYRVRKVPLKEIQNNISCILCTPDILENLSILFQIRLYNSPGIKVSVIFIYRQRNRDTPKKNFQPTFFFIPPDKSRQVQSPFLFNQIDFISFCGFRPVARAGAAVLLERIRRPINCLLTRGNKLARGNSIPRARERLSAIYPRGARRNNFFSVNIDSSALEWII